MIKMDSTDSRSNPISKVILLVVAIVIGLVGVYIRFADFAYSSEVGDVIMLIAIIFAIKIVFDIMK